MVVSVSIFLTGFVIMAIMHVDNTLHTKPQGTDHNFLLLPLAHALYKHYDNGQISAFFKRMRAVDQKLDYQLEWPLKCDGHSLIWPDLMDVIPFFLLGLCVFYHFRYDEQ